MKSILILLGLFLLINQPIKAVDPSPTPDDKAKDIVNIVKQIVNENITPTPKVSNSPKSFFGNITKIDEDNLIITYKNQTQIIKVNSETTYVDLKRNKSKIENFKVGQEILAMGYLNEDQSLDCKRIVATDPKSVENINQTITGQIVDISKESSIFTLTPNYNKNSPFQIKSDTKTKIVNLANKTVSSSDAIINGKKIIVIIKPDPKLAKTFYASKIIILDSPENSSPKPTPTEKP